MIKLEVNKEKACMKDSFVIRADEPMRVSFDVAESGQVIVYGYTGVEDDLDQDPILLYDSDSDMNRDVHYPENK